MKNYYPKLFPAFLFLLLSFSANSQNSANYSFATSTAASLTDMSSGTVQLVAAGSDDNASILTNIGFEFWFMGTRYSQFSANSNGLVRLGATVSTTQYALATGTVPLISALGSDLMVSTSGKVHYKIIGSAPNRVLVVEFKNMTIIYDGAGTSADGTYQVLLYETSNNIELVYGSMNRNSGTGFSGAMNPLWIGFSTTTTNYATYVTATSTLTTTGAATSQQYTLNSPIADLTSVADGSRKMFTFSPNVPLAPTGLNFTGVTAISMTLNWTDNSTDETGFAIYRSDDGGVTYNFITQVAANSTSYSPSTLTASTNYFWKVFAVRERLSSEVAGSQATLASGTITSNGTGGGLWSSTATWSGGVIPAITDDVTILDGDVVTIDIAATAYSVTVGQAASGVLQFEPTTARALTVSSNVTINSNGVFQSAATNTVTNHMLSLGGSLTNNGTLDFSTNANTAGAGITFTGVSNTTFAGTGATSDIRTLTINKGTSNASILELNTTNFTVRGTTTDVVVGGFLVMTNGTLKISGNFSYTGRTFATAAYTIPATFGVWLNNPNFTIAGQNGSPTLSGLLRVTQGTYNIGLATNNSMSFSTGSAITIEGGTINSTGRFGVATAGNAITYNQSGGTITVCTIGNSSATLGAFDLGTSLSSVINMSGGTIVCQLASTAIDYRDQAGSGITGVTGGTLQLGNASSGAAKTFNLRGIVPNVVVTNTSANHTATFSTTSVNYNNHSLNITINAGSTFNQGNALLYMCGAVLTNNGTLTGNGTSSRLIFNGLNNVAQSYTGTGVVTAPLNSLEIYNSLGFTIDPSVSNIVALRIIIFTGNVTNSNRLTLGNGGSTTGTIQIGNPTTPDNPGNFDVAPAFNLGTGGQVLYYLRFTNSRSTGVEVNPSRIVTSLTLDNNVSSLTLAGGDLTVTGTYAQTNGNFNLGSNTLTLGTSAAATGTFTYGSGTVIGKFKRWIAASTGNLDFPVGTASVKRNASINFTTAPATGGTLSGEWVPAPGSNNGLPLTEGSINVTSTSQDGYWRITAADGLSGGNYTGTFTATGISGVNDYTGLVLLKRSDASSPWTLDGTHVTATGSNAIPVISRSNMSGFSEFGIGGDYNINTLPVVLSSFTARRNGNANVIKWSTSQESNTRHYIVERSNDGRNFTKLQQVAASGNGGGADYSYTDNNPLKGINYYRVQIVDADNSSKYSPVRSVRNEGIADITIYPNPVKDVLNININADMTGKGNIVVTSMTGKTIYRKTISFEKGDNKITVDLSNVMAGAYIINVHLNNDIIVKEFSK